MKVTINAAWPARLNTCQAQRIPPKISQTENYTQFLYPRLLDESNKDLQSGEDDQSIRLMASEIL
jgi:hypothetical protein